eukprot:CAMPEP_0114262096 /NCGR_PEP_ID=MMETSP0058-20121206/21566_1 /TAXON_ID=36894 /ORGANISM="Pyramimonas parkeae, CCMP726" /LENGTH=37 /DNA_ID= /DNA_START= /DNA_END= /DNA_ORIENTATION=
MTEASVVSTKIVAKMLLVAQSIANLMEGASVANLRDV